LTFTEGKIDANDIESYYWWLTMDTLHKIFVGDFDLSHIDMDSFKSLTEKILRAGAFFDAIHAVITLGWFFIERGDFEKAGDMASLLGRIGAEYEHGHARVYERLLKVRIAVEQGRLKEAIDDAQRGLMLTDRLGLKVINFDFLSLKARSHVLLGDQESAVACFKHQEEIKSNTYLVPYYISEYSVVRSVFSVSYLEEAVNNGDTPRVRQLARESQKWVMQAMKASRKFKRDRVEVLRLMGTRSWLIGERNKALKSWGDSI
jgi:tetratricopeptide (TPR) repeat protein